jgi:flagellar motor switch protein FliM
LVPIDPVALAQILTKCLGRPVEARAGQPDDAIAWLALGVFVGPDTTTPVYALAVDVPLVAHMGAARAGLPAQVAEEAATSRINAGLWNHFAEAIAGMAEALSAGRPDGVGWHSARRLGPERWFEVLTDDRPLTVYGVSIPGYEGGNLALIDLQGSAELGAPIDELLSPSQGPSDGAKGWRPYSFARPHGLSHAHLKLFQVKMEEAARAIAAACNGDLNAPIRPEVQDVQLESWADSVSRLPEASTFISFQVNPLPGRFVIAWPDRLAMTVLDLLLGGDGEALGSPRVPSGLDLALIEPVYARTAECIASMFREILDVQVSDLRTHPDPKLVPGVLDRDTFIATSMSAVAPGGSHDWLVGIPVLAARPHIDEILGVTEAEPDATDTLLRDQLLGVPVEVSIGYGSIPVAMSHLLDLDVGDVIALGLDTDQPMALCCDDVEVASVRPSTDDGRILAKVCGPADRQDWNTPAGIAT